MSKGIEFEISAFLGEFDVTEATIENIEKLEDYIQQANTVANLKTGQSLVVDAIYDSMMDILRQVKPDSYLLQELWETEDETNLEGNEYTDLLQKNPMKSILTVKSFNCAEMDIFEDAYPEYPTSLHCGMKLNGWGVRIVYLNRQFVSATSRARASAGRDLTRQMRIILEKKDLLTLDDSVSDELIEIRGETLLAFHNLEKAREYKPDIVSAFSGVASMLRDSASDEEVALLDFVAYKVIMDDLHFSRKSEEYSFLEDDLGFETPSYWLIENVEKHELIDVLKETIEEISEDIFDEANPYEFFTDGVVVQVDDFDDFHSMGENGTKYDFGNIALKVGAWSQDNYYGFVQFIDYSKGKSKLSPVAIVSSEPNDVIFEIDDAQYQGLEEVMQHYNIEELNFSLLSCVKNYKDLGVATASGNRVKRVPLYEVANMLLLDIKANSILHFKYGGEAGVVPCREDGSLIKEVKGVDYIDSLYEGEILDYNEA
ncbi:NAD-dependent DNA ligase [Bacillus toyonensis]|uniref:NAD-dependent DNA ligase n=1 Tax=Bacillus toyonensis TaxID=155322 RepID=UPI000BFC8579|nr:NAD-dependent DNA ligase [Bacillus toyonensis]PHE64444.1 NAD-dependent DNA ligase [Bacillus toyonensis]